MKILITGFNGFLGGHIYKHLAKLDYEVDYLPRKEFLNESTLRLDEFKPDVVVHCAWPTDKDLHSTEHLEFAEWTCNFFNLCKERGIRVINLGSSSEYGVKYEPMEEGMVCEPINTYGIAKLAVTLYAKKLGYNTLRIFTPYGEGGRNFMSKYKESKRYGNPNDTRDYQPVSLVCQAVERLLHAQHLYGEIINVCSGKGVRNSDIVYSSNKWYKYTQSQTEPSVWVGNPEKMHKILNI